MNIDRRRFVGSAAGMAATTGVAADWFWPKHSVSYRRSRSFVAVLNATQYCEKVEALLMDGLRLFRLNVLGKSVLLKPNLVEDLPGPVNTNANIIGAAARCFLRLGASRSLSVRVRASTRHPTRSTGRGPETSSRGPTD